MPPKRFLPSALGLKKKKKSEKKKKKGETKTTVQSKASEEEAGAAAAVDSSRTVVLPHINNSSRCESQSIPSVPAEVHAEVKSLLARSKFEGSALRFALNAMRQENDKLKSALSILKEKYTATNASRQTLLQSGDAPHTSTAEQQRKRVELHPVLQKFLPLSEGLDPAAELSKVDGEGQNIAELYKSAYLAPTDAGIRRTMRKHAHALSSALLKELRSRLTSGDHTTETVAESLKVIRLGNDSFSLIYAAVWASIDGAEEAGVVAYEEEAANLLAVARGVKGNLKAVQRKEAKDPVQLFLDGSVAKRTWDAAVWDLVARCKVAGVSIIDSDILIPRFCKNFARIIEKAVLRPGDSGNASTVTDVVRAMLVVDSMRDAAKVLQCITAMAREGTIVVARVKDRFVASPSAGGWRDALINFYVKTASPGGALEHIGELQVAHSQMVNARAGLPGHLIYDRLRNALEIVKFVFGGKSVALKILDALHSLKDRLIDHPDRLKEIKEAEDEVGMVAGVVMFELPKYAKQLGSEASVGQVRKALGDYAAVVVSDEDKSVDADMMVKTLGEIATGYVVASPESRKLMLKSISGGVSSANAANWAHLDGEQMADFASVAKSWDTSKARTNTGVGWFGKQPDVAKWAGVKRVDAEGRMEELRFRGFTKVARLPDGIGNIPSLKILNLFGLKELATLPETIGLLKTLHTLTLSTCSKLKALPASLKDLHALKHLDISSCFSLKVIPSTIKSLSNLRHFNMSGLRVLKTIPSSIGELVALRDLDLSNCPLLERLPASIGSLANLIKLNVSYCSEMKHLPATIGNLEKLKEFNLESCTDLGVGDVPATLVNLKCLEEINVRGCASGVRHHSILKRISVKNRVRILK